VSDYRGASLWNTFSKLVILGVEPLPVSQRLGCGLGIDPETVSSETPLGFAAFKLDDDDVATLLAPGTSLSTNVPCMVEMVSDGWLA